MEPAESREATIFSQATRHEIPLPEEAETSPAPESDNHAAPAEQTAAGEPLSGKVSGEGDQASASDCALSRGVARLQALKESPAGQTSSSAHPEDEHLRNYLDRVLDTLERQTGTMVQGKQRTRV